jgi:glycosyltransferase involved in cell wall biosynthesis
MARIVYIVTQPITARYLLKGQLSFLRQKGMETFLITSPGQDLMVAADREKVEVYTVFMHREIRPFADLISLFRLFRLLRKLKPDIVNASTPKAGLLGMIAAFLAGVRIRIYTLRGLRLETKSGWQRFLLKNTERIASLCSHKVICVSRSLLAKSVAFRLVNPSKILVLGEGSSNGLDAAPFQIVLSAEEKEQLHMRLGIPGNVPVVGFVGRITKDKGAEELIRVFDILLASIPNLHLLIIGDFEEGDPVDSNIARRIKNSPQIIHAGFVPDPASFYQLMDILIFPSHREGFPNAPLEAAAAGIPTVGFEVTGVVDAIENGITGMLVSPFDLQALSIAILRYLQDHTLRQAHGQAGRQRVLKSFQQNDVWEKLYREYCDLLSQKRGISSAVLSAKL